MILSLLAESFETLANIVLEFFVLLLKNLKVHFSQVSVPYNFFEKFNLVRDVGFQSEHIIHSARYLLNRCPELTEMLNRILFFR